MQPYDGTGYGVSLYWRSKLKDIADKNDETCPCWSSKEPEIRFVGDSGLKVKVYCQDKACDKTFLKTEKQLVELFREFYKF